MYANPQSAPLSIEIRRDGSVQMPTGSALDDLRTDFPEAFQIWRASVQDAWRALKAIPTHRPRSREDICQDEEARESHRLALVRVREAASTLFRLRLESTSEPCCVCGGIDEGNTCCPPERE